jgi:uncharacterized phiE125 gp8 family phage protein
MPLKLVTSPLSGPIDLSEARAYLRLTSSSLDQQIVALIDGAVDYAQSMTGRQFAPATFELTLRAFPSISYANPCGLLYLPRPPLRDVLFVKYRSPAGALIALERDVDYYVDWNAEPATIEPVRDWPLTGDFPDAVQIQFVAGYGETGSPAETVALPDRAGVAIKALVSHWFDNPDPVDANYRTQPTEVPHHVSRLLRTLRVRDV